MTNPVDYARAQYRDSWLHHYAIGDPSWDTFVREPGNPIYTGKGPYEWPVNGFLFCDPPSGRWLAYVGLYPRGYWPAGPCLALRERSGGGWAEVGLAVQGNAAMFDGNGALAGGTPDVSVVYDGGQYHMIYDWASVDNARGGLAYACAERPEGPYQRFTQAVHADTGQTPILGQYVRAYAPTLFRRKNDWLILHAMSTAGNAGGMWAMACMTSPDPHGPYTSPVLLLYPQSERYLPALLEYYPAFLHNGYAYAPATSVARNRDFQCLFRAPLESAHLADAWELYQHGSLWHSENHPAEAQGIWGQTFSAQVDRKGVMRAYFTSKTRENIGTVHIAQRRWDQPFKDGFALSAPETDAYAILRQHCRTFRLRASIRASGSWSISWGCQAPLGPDRAASDAIAHPIMSPHKISWERNSDMWRLLTYDDNGETSLQSGYYGPPADGVEHLDITQDDFGAVVELNGQVVCVAAYPAQCGRMQLIARQGAYLFVEKFEVSSMPEPATEFWLASEAMAGAAADTAGREWQSVEDSVFRYGFGYASCITGARAKWNYCGGSFRLYSPRGPQYGNADVLVDGALIAQLNLHADEPMRSSAVLSYELSRGFHTVTLVAPYGPIPCDSLEVTVPLPESDRAAD